MNPLGEFRARPSLVLSIRQRCGFYAEYRRKMQEKVDLWGSVAPGPVSSVKNSSADFRTDGAIINGGSVRLTIDRESNARHDYSTVEKYNDREKQR